MKTIIFVLLLLPLAARSQMMPGMRMDLWVTNVSSSGVTQEQKSVTIIQFRDEMSIDGVYLHDLRFIKNDGQISQYIAKNQFNDRIGIIKVMTGDSFFLWVSNISSRQGPHFMYSLKKQ